MTKIKDKIMIGIIGTVALIVLGAFMDGTPIGDNTGLAAAYVVQAIEAGR